MFFRSVDGNTCGPVCEFPLAVLGAVGVRLDYRVSKTVTVVLALLGAVAVWLTLRRVADAALAQMATLPLLALIAFAHCGDFLQYSTEQLPAALLAIAVAVGFWAWDGDGNLVAPRRLGWAGFVLGAIPFAKLQAAPASVYCEIGFALLVAAGPRLSLSKRLLAIGTLLGGALLVPIVTLAAIYGWGQGPEFWRSYIVNNLHYAGARWSAWDDCMGLFVRTVGIAEGFGSYVLPGTLFVVLSGLAFPVRDRTFQQRVLWFAVGQCLVALYCVVAPGREFQHYLQLLFFPLALGLGLIFAAGMDFVRRLSRSVWIRCLSQAAYGAIFLAICVGPQWRWRSGANPLLFGMYSHGGAVLKRSKVAEEVLRHVHPGDRLAIWGWTPRLWVETGLPQGTRDGSTSRQTEVSPMQEVYQRRYLRDLKRNRPAVFVDSVGGKNFYHDRNAYAHELAPKVAEYVATNYRMISEVDGMRLYLRNDRE